MAKVKFTLLVPLNYNDGTKIPDGVRNSVLDELYILAGGYTLAGNVSGTWRTDPDSSTKQRLSGSSSARRRNLR